MPKVVADNFINPMVFMCNANSYTAVVFMLFVVLLTGCTRQPDVLKWSRWSQTFEAAEKADPETKLTVTLTDPNGDTQTVPGFWDGGTTWRVRFMPDEAGTWSYKTSSEPSVPGLDGETGVFQCGVDEQLTNRFLRHGAVQVSENGRHLEHVDGTKFFWLGDTAWNGALRSTGNDWENYLAARAKQQFTAIQFVTTQWRAADADAEGQVAYTGYKDISINPAFFQRLDKKVSAINDAGLLAAPVILWALGNKKQVPGKLPEEEAVKLARYITARYGAYHVAWFLAGDENFSGERGKRWEHIGQSVFNGPHHKALVTLHPQGRQWHFKRFMDEDWYDFVIYQSSHGGGPNTLNWILSGPPATQWKQKPIRPIINSEPGYEDHVAWEREGEKRHTAFDVRQQAYYSLLRSPTAGITYGGHGIWSWETTPTEPLNHKGSGVAKPWDKAIELPGSQDMAHIAKNIMALDWWRLRPAQSLLTHQPGGDNPVNFVAAARSKAGDLAVLYLPRGGKVSLQMDQLVSDVQARWFNPRSGTYRSARSDGKGTFTAPDDNDWVLVFG